MFGGRDSSVITCSCWSWSSAASSIVTIRSSPGMNADIAFSVVVLPVPVPPEMRMFSLPFTQAARNCAAFGEIDPNVIRSFIVYGSRANFRIVSVGPLQRERRDDRVDAAAVGEARVDHRRGLVDAAADLRDDLVDDAQQVRVVEEAGDRALELAGALDVDPVVRVDHDLGHGVVAQERLERAVAEDVVGDLADELAPLLARQRRAVERELLGDRAQHALGEVLVRLALEELGAELLDARVVDARLQLGVRVERSA